MIAHPVRRGTAALRDFPRLGRAKTPAFGLGVEILPRNRAPRSQIILHTRGPAACWRMAFSTLRRCMSFHTARVRSGESASFATFPLYPQEPTWERHR